jgi:hypothetical protein
VLNLEGISLLRMFLIGIMFLSIREIFLRTTHGCPLVGKTQSENYVGSSAKALDELLDKFAGKKNLKLTIIIQIKMFRSLKKIGLIGIVGLSLAGAVDAKYHHWPRNAHSYEIQKGDNFSDLSNKYGITTREF